MIERMYLRTIEEAYVNRRWNTAAIKHHDVFSCDECSHEFTLGYKAAHATNHALTFCSKTCNKKARSSGKLAEKWRRTKLERYGVEYSSQVPGAAEKMIATRLENTSAKAPSDPMSSSNMQFKATMIERHGVEHPSKSPMIREKKRKTYVERYGVDNPFSNGSPFRSYDSCVRGGQVGYRALINKKGDDALSKPEAMLAKQLRDVFGTKNVMQQIEVHHGGRKPWLVDFYVSSADVYVEEDGVFWHGLDHPYEQLHESKRLKYDADRMQDEWFRSRGRRLVRITDEEVKMCHELNDWSLILTRLEG
jgi:hypothetical protein